MATFAVIVFEYNVVAPFDSHAIILNEISRRIHQRQKMITSTWFITVLYILCQYYIETGPRHILTYL